MAWPADSAQSKMNGVGHSSGVGKEGRAGDGNAIDKDSPNDNVEANDKGNDTTFDIIVNGKGDGHDGDEDES